MAKRTPAGKRGKRGIAATDRQLPDQQRDLSVDAARREVLKRIGMFGAYTAPAILAMSWSDKAAAIGIDSTSTD
jgi:hypothetical protein